MLGASPVEVIASEEKRDRDVVSMWCASSAWFSSSSFCHSLLVMSEDLHTGTCASKHELSSHGSGSIRSVGLRQLPKR